ncbi:hypothetical protein CoNPh11_CDS0216 [Staphylococcus phage S-CoN_Ph11]|nr:hypothetical protein CoNPh11_CDS0216 [Staphylococcus phage S-CoN_Ph11]
MLSAIRLIILKNLCFYIWNCFIDILHILCPVFFTS